MNEDTTTTKLITIGAAAALAPGGPSPKTVWAWMRRGVRSRSGQQVRLGHVRLGRTLYTTAAHLAQFAEDLARSDVKHFDRPAAAANDASPAKPRARRTAEDRREREVAETRQQLAKAGLI